MSTEPVTGTDDHEDHFRWLATVAQAGAGSYYDSVDQASAQWAAAEIARLRAENGRYQAMVLRATEAIENIGRREEALRAEVAELRSSIAHVVTLVDEIGAEDDDGLCGIKHHCYGALIAVEGPP